MKELPVAEWLRSLDHIAESLAAAVAALDRHEAAFAPLLAAEMPSSPAADPAAGLAAAIDERIREHDRRWAVAAELAGSVDASLAQRESAVRRWRETFPRWVPAVEQTASGPPAGVLA